MELADLVKNLTYTVIQGQIGLQIEGLTSDSRKVCRNTAFVCIVGAVSDGHQYITAAARAGAAAVIVQAGSGYQQYLDESTQGLTVLETENTRLALALMSSVWFGEPSKSLFTIGITGTKGKTTTTYMVKNVLEACGVKTGLIGTIETVVGSERYPSHMTTPESYEIQEIFRHMADEGCKAVVMEVSSQALKLDRTAGILFDIGVFTNLEPDHIGPNEHESFEEYLNCKARLFSQCKLGIVNADDPHATQVTAGASCRLETYGITSPSADLRAEQIEMIHQPGKIGLTYHCTGLMDFPVELQLPGMFSVYNSLCAIAVTRHFNADIEKLQQTLREVRVRGRIELVKVSDRFTLIIDYAHNAMALKSILATLREYQPHRLICLFGCGGNRSRERRFEMGEVSGKMADLTIITSDNPRYEEPEAIINDIITGIAKTSGKHVDIIDRKEAIRYAIEHGEQGDIIVLAGKGHEDYQEIKGVRYPMDERALIDEAVRELKASGWQP